MHVNDVKISRLTSNLFTLAEETAAYCAAETRRSAESVEKARNSALTSVIQETNRKKRGRAAVVSWDLGHNPVGRAYVLYQLLAKDWEVDLIGPMWSRYGTQVWGPLRDSDLKTRTFQCSTISDFVPNAEVLVAGQHYDIVYVCKPRLPSLYLGAIIKQACSCPMIVDVDDFELSFFKDETYASVDELKENIHAALHEPFEELATRYSQTLISAADAVTVSNVALRSRFGGHIVRHARDEETFDNSAVRREAARQRLGISSSDFALMFIGTPRAHKGILAVAKALHELNDVDVVFHVVGDTTDKKMKSELEEYSQARIVMHANCAFDELPDLLAGADLVPLIQDVNHAISQYQIPAKVSDALALGIPVIASPTPPLVDLIASGAIHEAQVETLAPLIGKIKEQCLIQRTQGFLPENSQERRSFLGELGMDINRTRLKQAINEAQLNCRVEATPSQSVVSIFSRSGGAETDDQLPSALAEMVSLVRNHYRGLRGDILRSARERRGEETNSTSTRTKSRSIMRMPSIIGSRAKSYDIAFFWKQNDSNMYGRRADMIAKEFTRSNRVRKLLHLDAPLSAPSMNEHFERVGSARDQQQSLIMRNLIDRQMGVFDNDILRSRTQVFSRRPNTSKLLGEPVLAPGTYVRYVNEQLEEHGMRARNTVAWFCPVIWDAPELIEKIGFGAVIADLIDDQRAWDGTTESRKKLERSYQNTLGAADLVFANCDSLAEAMQMYANSKINVVPNGAERFDRFPDAPIPEALKNIKGPIVGYVGNLRDRIDWTLLHELSTAMPDVSFVFFGPSSDNLNADSLAKHENVHVLGVVPYDELAFHLKSFDVGLVPHINNQLTERMNPLKVYNYFAAGLPIVSSEVANLENLGNGLKTATTATEFVAAIRDSIANPIDTRADWWQSTMNNIAWENRVGNILEIMDHSLHRKLRKSA